MQMSYTCLKKLRETAGLTQAEVAHAVGGCGRQLVSNWERGRSKPYQYAPTLARLYGVELEQIFRAIDSPLNFPTGKRTCAKELVKVRDQFEEGGR